MQNSHLSNLRWLGCPSDSLGRDWYEKIQFIDQKLEGIGLDLTDADVYLLFSDSPRNIKSGEGECFIARSVVGPKKELQQPLTLIDWKALPVWREKVKGEGLEELLESADEFRTHLIGKGCKLQKSFILCLKRQLEDELKIWVEVVFYE